MFSLPKLTIADPLRGHRVIPQLSNGYHWSSWDPWAGLDLFLRIMAYFKCQHCKLANVLILSLTVCFVSQKWLAPATDLAAASSHGCSMDACACWHSDLVWGLALHFNVLGYRACILYLEAGVVARRSCSGIVLFLPATLQLCRIVPVHASVFISFPRPRNCLRNNPSLNLGTAALNLRNWRPISHCLSCPSFHVLHVVRSPAHLLSPWPEP